MGVGVRHYWYKLAHRFDRGIRQRRAYKANLPHTRLELCHTENCQLLPDRIHLLQHLPKGGHVAEIGVAYGDYTLNIVRHNRPEKLHLIDAWAKDRFSPGLQAVRDKFSNEIENGTIDIRQGLSLDVLKSLEPQSLDWVYIDTDHSFTTTLKELQVCAMLVKKGGFIAGHDFCTGSVVTPTPYGVIEAVTKFCKDHHWQFAYLTVESGGHFSFALKRL